MHITWRLAIRKCGLYDCFISTSNVLPSNPLNLRQLHYWLTVVDSGSFSAAAPRLAVTQSNLSQQVAALERRVGGRLLDRLPKGVQLTALGREVAPDARAALAAAQRIERTAGQVLRLEIGILEIATFPAMIAGGLLGILEDWHEHYPEVAIQLREFGSRRALAEAVASGIGDVGIGARPHTWTGSIVSLGWETLTLVLPLSLQREHAGGPIPLRELAGERWVTYSAENGLAEIAAGACNDAGFSPVPAVEVATGYAAAKLAASGMGPALVPTHEVPAGLEDYCRPIQHQVSWEVAAFTRAGWSAMGRQFADVAVRHRWAGVPNHL